MKSSFTLLVAFTLCFTAALRASAAQGYIKEVESLLNSLPSKDPSRPALSLRLADAYFDDSLKLTTANMGTPTAQAKIERRKAIGLYEESLSGFNGMFSKPSGDLRAKVQFQLARIYNDEGNQGKAQELWKALVSEEIPPDIRRESILRLAEILEQQRDPASVEQAKKYYLQALRLCGGLDVCSYSHYRLAWVEKAQGHYPEALAEMQKALWDSKGQVREEALRDLIAFLGEKPGDGHEALASIENLDNRLHRPTLLMDLARSFYSRGNRQAGTFVLEQANKKNPELKNYISLLEEYYGFRDWQKFRAGLDDVIVFRDLQEARGQTPWKTDPDIEKILRRLTVQLDGERTSAPEHAGDFKNAVMLYLSFFGDGSQRSKMIDGWLVAETDATAKIAQLEKWIATEKTAGRKQDELHLREIRASEAQKINKYDIVATEMNAIGSLYGDPAKKREAYYHRAYAFYQDKKLEGALPLFQELARINKGDGSPDAWALQSQHLALDILGQKKAYGELLVQARSWINDSRYEGWILHDPKHAAELREISKIAQNAAFEEAVGQGVTPLALDLFKEYCDRGIELPKSCENAQVLAFKLKNEPVFIAMLRKLGKKTELTTELEVSGQFGEAAETLHSQLTNKSPFRDYLKVALLYELGGDFTHRDAVLKTLTALAAAQKTFGPEEDLIYATLKEANLLTAASLKWPWKKDNHQRLISELEEAGHGTPETHKLLISSCDYMGSVWEKAALTEVKRADDAQRKIVFTGKGSKRKFEQRLAGLKKLNSVADCYLQGATPRARVIMATLLAKSQYDMASEVRASPIPEGLDAAVVENLKKSLDQMAAPFDVKGKAFDELAQTQLEKISDPTERLSLKMKMTGKDLSTVDLLSPPTTTQPAMNSSAGAIPASSTLTSALAQLHRNPNERQPLEMLKDYYQSAGKPRLAAYFQGRINQLAPEGTK